MCFLWSQDPGLHDTGRKIWTCLWFAPWSKPQRHSQILKWLCTRSLWISRCPSDDKPEPGECVPVSRSPSRRPPSLVSAVFYYLYFLCGPDGWLAADESWGGARGITDGRWIRCLPGSLKESGLKEEDGDVEPSQAPVPRPCPGLAGSWGPARSGPVINLWPLLKRQDGGMSGCCLIRSDRVHSLSRT